MISGRPVLVLLPVGALLASLALGLALSDFPRGQGEVPWAPAVVVMSGHVDEYTSICNAVVVGGVAYTVGHCLQPDADGIGIASGGDDLCSTAGWRHRTGDRLPGSIPGELVAVDLGDQPTNRQPPPAAAAVVGFGREARSGASSCDLSVVPVEIVDLAECEVALTADYAVPAHWGCLRAEHPLCPGWSGSAVIDGRRVVGVVSHGEGCDGGLAAWVRLPPSPATTE